MLWLFLGILIGLGLFWIVTQTKTGKISVKWYQWVLGFLAVALFLLTIQNYLGFKKELEPVAANFVLLAMGLPSLILAALVWFIPKISAKIETKSHGNKAIG